MALKFKCRLYLLAEREGDASCTFDTTSQCGYVDVSEGPTKWMRHYNADSGE